MCIIRILQWMPKCQFLKLLTYACLLVCPSLANGSLFFSPKALGRAGAIVAQPLDAMSIAYNPAAGAFIDNRWDIGLNWSKEWGHTTYTDNPNIGGKFSSHDSWDHFFMPEFGVSQWMCECTMTWGFVIYNRSYYKTSYKFANPLFGTKKLGLEYLHYVASPSWSIAFGCDHALGVTIDFHGHRLKIDGLENFDNDDQSDSPGNVTDEGYEYAGGIGATIGWISHFSNKVSFGLSWSPQVELIGRFRDYKGIVADEGRLRIPQRWTGALAVEILCGLIAEFDLEHVQYNQIRALNNDLMPRFEDDPDFGDDDGVGLGWRDQTIFRFGLEWEINEEYSVRMGYLHQRSPVKSSDTLANSLVPNIIEDYITWGGTWHISCLCELSFYGAYGFERDERGRESIPESLGGGEVDLKERKWMAGFSFGKKF